MSYFKNTNIQVALPKTLFLAIAAQTLMASYSHAEPTGGKVVGGEGSIKTRGATTRRSY